MSSIKVISVVFAAVVILTASCGYVDEPIALEAIEMPRMRSPEPPTVAAAPADTTIANRFANVEERVEGGGMMRWSEKYESLSEKYTTLTEDNLNLTKANSELKRKLMSLEAELNTTKRELEDANLFLQDMHKELTQWKGDVLGFREEMRNADGAQLVALTRILKLLGAEGTEPLAMAANGQKP